MKHTPGPWTCSERHPDNGRIQIGTEGDFIGELYAHASPIDARLIATAPEMLKAIQDMIVAWDFDAIESVRMRGDAIRKMRDLLTFIYPLKGA